jgi:hypothetical protein
MIWREDANVNARNDLVGDFLATFDTPAVIGDELIMIDLATAHTCLDIAEMTRNVERGRKNVELAREALNAIDRYGADPHDALRRTIERSRRQLQLRLMALERRFEMPYGADGSPSTGTN